MSQKIKNEDGSETEMFTAEELEAKAAETQAKADEEKAQLQAEKETELAAAKEELEKLQKKDMNFENLRKKAEGTQKNEGDLAKSVEQMQKELNEFKRVPIDDAKNEFIKQHIGTNKELKDKFDVFWGKLGGDVKTKAEAEAVMAQAFMLASDGKKPNTSSRMQQVSVNDNFADIPDGQESEQSKEFGSKLGVSEQDKKDYVPGKINLMAPNVGKKK